MNQMIVSRNKITSSLIETPIKKHTYAFLPHLTVLDIQHDKLVINPREHYQFGPHGFSSLVDPFYQVLDTPTEICRRVPMIMPTMWQASMLRKISINLDASAISAEMQLCQAANYPLLPPVSSAYVDLMKLPLAVISNETTVMDIIAMRISHFMKYHTYTATVSSYCISNINAYHLVKNRMDVNLLAHMGLDPVRTRAKYPQCISLFVTSILMTSLNTISMNMRTSCTDDRELIRLPGSSANVLPTLEISIFCDALVKKDTVSVETQRRCFHYMPLAVQIDCVLFALNKRRKHVSKDMLAQMFSRRSLFSIMVEMDIISMIEEEIGHWVDLEQVRIAYKLARPVEFLNSGMILADYQFSNREALLPEGIMLILGINKVSTLLIELDSTIQVNLTSTFHIVTNANVHFSTS